MRITDKKENILELFVNLKLGEVFESGNNIYIKTQKYCDHNALNLMSYANVYFSDVTKVKVRNAELVLE